MGDYLSKSKKIKNINPDLNESLLPQKDLLSRILYLETKLDNLDAKVWSLEANMNASFLVVNSDINNILYNKN